VLGLAIRVPTLGLPLLEGAAGKQTHTAMVARNLYRGTSSWTRPRVDDIGHPGYFLKEAPILPTVAAGAYTLLGGPSEWVGRLLPTIAWLLVTPAVVAIAASFAGGVTPLVAGVWFAIAPLGVVYSRAFMTDAAAVAAAVLALRAALGWRREPRRDRALATALWTALALLLKLHAALWIGPAVATLALWPDGPPRRARVRFLLTMILAGAVAAPWYVHAWSVHRDYPIPGAMTAAGWVDPSLWWRPELYRTILAQELWMVFTPVGLVLAALGVLDRRRGGAAWASLLAWSAGVILQCVIFATRLFDEPARRTEYYHLAMVPIAAIWIGLGFARLLDLLSWRPLLRAGAGAIVVLAALGLAARATVEALTIAPEYAKLIEDCAAVQRATAADAEIAVVADRPGTVHYYCDRRGLTLLSGEAKTPETLAMRDAAATARIAAELQRIRYMYVPFPEVLERSPQLARDLETNWRPSPGIPAGLLLYERRRTARSADAAR
jgi:4-amino-4-deoxy-L-arabinose transferase-like glycosyltransferase